MRYDNHFELERWARDERSKVIGEYIAAAVAAAIQLVRKAWRSSSSSGTNSKALS